MGRAELVNGQLFDDSENCSEDEYVDRGCLLAAIITVCRNLICLQRACLQLQIIVHICLQRACLQLEIIVHICLQKACLPVGLVRAY